MNGSLVNLRTMRPITAPLAPAARSIPDRACRSVEHYSQSCSYSHALVRLASRTYPAGFPSPVRVFPDERRGGRLEHLPDPASRG
jgi:hypothetical protein